MSAPGGLERVVRGIGWTSVALAAAGTVAPRRLVRAAGLRVADDAAVPLLVRFGAARQLALGLALLTRQPTPVHRSAGLFLPLTALDAAAALQGVRTGVLAKRGGAMAIAVLAANVGIHRASRG